ncbi:MAG: sigma-70 family RNA polymerase sigma factor, partial [Opitutales bacterium]
MPADLAQLYDAHAQALYAFALNLTRREADACDVLHDIFRQLAAHPDLLARVRDERAFLLRLAHNRAIDLLRRQTTREKIRDTLARDDDLLFAPAASPDESAFRRALAAALAELPPEQRAVAHLKLWENLTFAQIAETLDLSPNTAASRYRYALDKLQTRLRPLYNEIQNPWT